MYTYVYTGERPAINQLLKVMRRQSLATRWYELGVELLPNNSSSLDVIEVNHRIDVNTCCRKMFQMWLDNEPFASWNKLVRALNEIELHNAARAVSMEYMSGMYKHK